MEKQIKVKKKGCHRRGSLVFGIITGTKSVSDSSAESDNDNGRGYDKFKLMGRVAGDRR